jgi:hypothetical protein
MKAWTASRLLKDAKGIPLVALAQAVLPVLCPAPAQEPGLPAPSAAPCSRTSPAMGVAAVPPPGLSATGVVSERPIVIHYGLNDSHSQDWARLNDSGQIGITYFQHDAGSHAEGTLYHKTIHSTQGTTIDSLARGTHLEKSVLLYDEAAQPHIFVAQSTDEDQIIDHYFKDDHDQWEHETISHFYAEGGRFIYELSAATGPDHTFHLLILKTRSNIDGPDFMEAWRGANLYHLTNATGSWERELIHHYNMAYTYDMYVKTSCRQDIAIDQDGHVHVVFSEQLTGQHDPSRLLYATNRTGSWEIEIALSNEHGLRDDAGWFPSLSLDNFGTPYISCMYVNRVMTYSATYSSLYLLKRTAGGTWQYDIIARFDDGYYGSDGRDYTGGLTHLVFDSGNTPHLVFTDIASTHWPVFNQCWNVGNIRYGTLREGQWNLETIYRQPLPTGFYNATEMFGLCLVLSEATDSIHVIGQELEVTGEYQYTSQLLEFSWPAVFASSDTTTHEDPPAGARSGARLMPICPNPFQRANLIEYSLPRPARVELHVLTASGQRVCRLVGGIQEAGDHQVLWNTLDAQGRALPSGAYLCTLRSEGRTEARRMLLVR